MSDPANTPAGELPDRLRRQLAGTCLYGRCARGAKDGADYCAEHHEAVKRWGREWRRKQRRAIRKAKQCRDCGVASKRIRCSDCRKLQREAKARRVEHAARRVEHAPSEPRTKLEVHPDGYTRVRTIGRGVRGQKSRAELDDDLRQDLDDAIADAQAVRDGGIEELRSTRVHELGRVAKREAHSIVADRLLRAARTLTSVAESLCPGRAREVAAAIADAVDVE